MPNGTFCSAVFMSSKRADNTPSKHISPVLLWLAAAVCIVACVDLVALTFIWRMFGTVFQDKDFAGTLEYANPYIGLEELYQSGKVNSSHIEPIVIRPRISAQVFVEDPDRLAPRGEHDYWHETWGMLSPNERRLHVTPTVSALLS